MKRFVCLAAFGLAAWFGAPPAPAAAQYIVSYNGWGPRAVVVGWGGYGPRFYRPVYPAARVSYYPPTVYYQQEQAVDVKTVTLRLHVPSDARVWIEGKETSQSGADREFVSPALASGRRYVYHIRVQWDKNGKTTERKREVSVQAGDRITLNIDK
jgi:uncharacterized protein (TIGR03000 family)